MNDQLSDAANKGLLLDIMQYWVTLPMWYITRFIMIVSEACLVITQAILSTARPVFGYNGWLQNFMSALIDNWYPFLFMLAWMFLGLTFLLISMGTKIQFVQPKVFVKWTLVMLLLAQFGATLYVQTVTFVVETPTDLMLQIVKVIPSTSANVLTATVGGTTYTPFDVANEDYQARARVLGAVEPTGCLTQVSATSVCSQSIYVPRDVVLAAWHASMDDLMYGTKSVERTVTDGTVIFDGMPADYERFFFPDSTQPWYSGSFTNDPNGPQKRRDAMVSASTGTLQALFGVIFSIAALLPHAITLAFTLSGALLFLLAVFFAPVGLFSENRLWVAAVVKSFFKLTGWQFALTLVSLFFTYILFGTKDNPGIGFAYPALFIVIPIYTWAHWKAFKFTLGLCWNGFSQVRKVVTGDPTHGLLEETTHNHTREEQTNESMTYTSETDHAHEQLMGAAHHFQPTGTPTTFAAGQALNWLTTESVSPSSPSIHDEPLPDYGAAIRTTREQGGNVGTMTTLVGPLGHRTSAIGHYLQWTQSQGISANDAGAIVHDIQEHGVVRDTTARTLDPALRTQAAALAHQFAAPTTPMTVQGAKKSHHYGRDIGLGALAGAAIIAGMEADVLPTPSEIGDHVVDVTLDAVVGDTGIEAGSTLWEGTKSLLGDEIQTTQMAQSLSNAAQQVFGDMTGSSASAIPVPALDQTSMLTKGVMIGGGAAAGFEVAKHRTVTPDATTVIQPSVVPNIHGSVDESDSGIIQPSATPHIKNQTSDLPSLPVMSQQSQSLVEHHADSVLDTAAPEVPEYTGFNLDHAVEVKAAELQNRAQAFVDDKMDALDHRMATAISGKEIADGITYEHDNAVDYEYLFEPESSETVDTRGSATAANPDQTVTTKPSTTSQVNSVATIKASSPSAAMATTSEDTSPPEPSTTVIEQPQLAIQETVDVDVTEMPPMPPAPFFTPPVHSESLPPVDVSSLDPAIISWNVEAGTIQHATVDADDPHFPTGIQESSLDAYLTQHGGNLIAESGDVQTPDGTVMSLDSYLQQRTNSSEVLTVQNWLREQDDVLELRHNGQTVIVDNGTPEGMAMTSRDYIAHLAQERQTAVEAS